MASRRKHRSPARLASAEALANLPPMRGLHGHETSHLVLDGGLATQLEAMGEDLSGVLWSARLLLDAPEKIAQAHAAFLDASADIIISASYQCSVPLLVSTLGIEAARAEALIAESVAIAKRARDAHRPTALVAASIGPYGACLADGSEYTGAYAAGVAKAGGLGDAELTAWHRPRFEILARSGCDLLACETLPCRAEARALIALLQSAPHAKAYVSFSCATETTLCSG